MKKLLSRYEDEELAKMDWDRNNTCYIRDGVNIIEGYMVYVLITKEIQKDKRGFLFDLKVGQSKCFKERMLQHLRNEKHFNYSDIEVIFTMKADTEVDMEILENELRIAFLHNSDYFIKNDRFLKGNRTEITLNLLGKPYTIKL